MNADTKLWMSRHHPSHYERDGKLHARCPTCQDLSPCRVREVFDIFDVLVHANEVVPPKWWNGERDAQESTP